MFLVINIWLSALLFQVINVLSNDGQRLFEAATFGPLLLIIPILLLIGAAYAILLLRLRE